MQAQLTLDAEFAPDSQARQILAAIGTAEVGPVTFSRVTQTEVDLVAAHGRLVRAVGSVTWRTTAPFDGDDAAVLRGGRGVVPGADDAALVAVCPAGAAGDAGVDLVLTADDLLAAWRVRTS